MLGRRLAAIVAAFVFSCGAAFADDSTPTGYDALDPPGQAEAEAENPLLASVLLKAQQTLDFAAACKGKECPKVDCELAGQLYSDLKKLEYLLRAEIHYSQLGSDAALAHHKALVEQSIRTGTNLSNAQNALAWQQFFHNLSKSIADVASLADSIRSLANKGLGDNWGDTMEQLDMLEQRLRTVDGLSTRIAKGTGAEGAKDLYKPHATPPIPGFDNTRKATVDVLKAIRKYKKEMKDSGFWDASKKLFNPSTVKGGDAKKFLDVKEGLRKNLLSWTHKLLVAYDDKLMKEREARIDDLVRDQSAEDSAIAKAFLEYQKAARKRDIAEEAMKQVKAALKALQECLAKAKCNSTYGFQRPQLPTFDEKHWGDALKIIEARLKEVVDGMTIPTVEEDCPPAGATDAALRTGEGFTILVTTDSTEWCHFRPTTPMPVPFFPGAPVTLAPPMMPGGPMMPFTPGMPLSPMSPMPMTPMPMTPMPMSPMPMTPMNPAFPSPFIGNPMLPTSPIMPMTPMNPPISSPFVYPGYPMTPTPTGPIFYPGMPSTGPVVTRPMPETTPRGKKGPPKITIFVNVKASKEAIKRGASGTQLPGQLVKFVPPATQNPALPGTKTAKKDTNTGHNDGPIQVRTDKNNKAVLVIPLTGKPGGKKKPGGDKTTGAIPANYTLELNIDPTQTSVVMSGKGVPAKPTIEGYRPTEETTINGKKFYIFYLPDDVAKKAVAGNHDPDLIIEINICFTKEPLPPGKPLGDHVRARDALPGATLHLLRTASIEGSAP